MLFFIDTANVDEIKQACKWGFVDGVTTNPTLVAKMGRSQEDIIREIAAFVDGPISAEVIATDAQGMMDEGDELARIHKNVVIKLPMTEAGMIACKYFSNKGIKTNVTLVFSCNQALLAAKNGASYVSPFLGRLDDIGYDGIQLIAELRTLFDNYQFETNILAASIRHPLHVHQAGQVGADVATIPFNVLKALFNHPLTDKGLAQFLADHANAQ